MIEADQKPPIRRTSAIASNREGTIMKKSLLHELVAASLLTLPALTLAAGDLPGQRLTRPVKPIEVLSDSAAVSKHFRALGYKVHGGIDRATTDQVASVGRTFPTFSSSFSVGGATYPFTMIGYPPKSGQVARIKSVIIPLRMNFQFFGPNFDQSHTFEPGPAVAGIVASPLYQNAFYLRGFRGQFIDQMQRAAFWNQMDEDHEWHVLMQAPQILSTVDIEVTPETGALSADPNGNLFGDVLFDFMDAEIQTILQFLNLDADTLPIFVTYDVTNQALGYHNASTVTDQAGVTSLQTYIFTSWLDPTLVPPIFADVSTFNHELAEWTNDPFVNNVVPTWVYPPPTDPAATCSGNPFLEVGDPQGNGATYVDFPAANIPINGVTYHLQQLVLWQWFTDQVPSSAYGGWYTFPIPSSLTVPAVYCN
jgi:hypothetical protein